VVPESSKNKPGETVEVDVIGLSMGGVVARYCERQHFWEVGMRGFRVRDVAARMSRYFEVMQVYRNRDWNPSQNFVLRSRRASAGSRSA